MLEKIIVFVSMIALIAFCGVVVGYVAEPDLIIITTLMLALASHDFWVSVFKSDGALKLDTSGSLEASPTGVSGKPLDTAKELEADLEKSARAKTESKK